MLIFGLIEMLHFEFFSDLEFLRRAPIAPDAATARGSLPRLCVDRACPELILPFYRGGYCAGIHIPYVVWVFGKLHAQLEVWRVVRSLLEDALVITRLLNNRCSRSVNVVDLRSW